MTKHKTISKLLLILIFSLVLSGCSSKKEMNKAVAEAKIAKVELAKVKDVLENTHRQKKVLEEDIAKISEQCENIKLELADAIRNQENFQNEFNELAQQQDTATDQLKEAQITIQKLNEQLSQEKNKPKELQNFIVQLQATITQLRSQIEEMNKSKQSYEESNEPSNEQIEDENNI